jgi:hypothetical protein
MSAYFDVQAVLYIGKAPGTRGQNKVSLTFVARGALGMVLLLAFAAKYI